MNSIVPIFPLIPGIFNKKYFWQPRHAELAYGHRVQIPQWRDRQVANIQHSTFNARHSMSSGYPGESDLIRPKN